MFGNYLNDLYDLNPVGQKLLLVKTLNKKENFWRFISVTRRVFFLRIYLSKRVWQ
jgi:hypothetical protein